MSTGGILGAVVGAAVGFFIPGGTAITAMYGASFGLAVGMYLDPLKPDLPSLGTPLPLSQIMNSTLGDPLPEVIGTVKIMGHLLAYGRERSEEITETTSQSGGKGGGGTETSTRVVGTKYFMTWALGICIGPIDTLYTILKGDDVVWSGSLSFTGSNHFETIVIDGLGSCTFYFGTPDQTPNSIMGEITNSSLNSPLRNFCWVLFNDCFIGNFARVPTFSFVVKKIHACSFYGTKEISVYDANPMNALWYILNDLSQIPESFLDSADFGTVAATLLSEGRGLSILLDKQQPAISYLENILMHLDCILRYGSDGKFHPKLMRNDYVVGSLPSITETDLLDDPDFSRRSWVDTANLIKVQYSEITTV